MYYSIKYHLQNFSEISDQAFQKENPDPCFFVSVLRLCELLFCISEKSRNTERIWGCRSPPYAVAALQVSSILFFCGCRLRNKMLVLSHSPAAFLSGWRRMSPPAKRPQGFCVRAVRSALAAARRFRRHNFAASLSLRTTSHAPPLQPLGWTA